MHKSRITIAGLLGLIVFCGFVFAGLRSGSYDWFRAIYTLTFIALTYAAIAARYRGPFWYGFAVAGWAYFLVGFGPWINRPDGAVSQDAINLNLVSSSITEFVSERIAREEGPPLTPWGSVSNLDVEFLRIPRTGVCHCALTMLFACLGGYVARTLARRPMVDERQSVEGGKASGDRQAGRSATGP